MASQLAKHSSWRYKLREKFKSYDMFGQVLLTWAGGDTFTTVWGATISVIIKLGIWAFFIFRIVLMATRFGPSYTTATLRLTPETDGPFLPSETGFAFAFGL